MPTPDQYAWATCSLGTLLFFAALPIAELIVSTKHARAADAACDDNSSSHAHVSLTFGTWFLVKAITLLVALSMAASLVIIHMRALSRREKHHTRNQDDYRQQQHERQQRHSQHAPHEESDVEDDYGDANDDYCNSANNYMGRHVHTINGNYVNDDIVNRITSVNYHHSNNTDNNEHACTCNAARTELADCPSSEENSLSRSQSTILSDDAYANAYIGYDSVSTTTALAYNNDYRREHNGDDHYNTADNNDDGADGIHSQSEQLPRLPISPRQQSTTTTTTTIQARVDVDSRAAQETAAPWPSCDLGWCVMFIKWSSIFQAVWIIIGTVLYADCNWSLPAPMDTLLYCSIAFGLSGTLVPCLALPDDAD